MPKFSNSSKDKLKTCHPILQCIMNEAIKAYDFTILCGYRGESAQNKAYEKGNSKLKFPKSKHNKIPSLAVDIAPYPIDWNDIERFKELNYVVMNIANYLCLDQYIQWGGTWKKFVDYPHYQIKGL